MARLHYLQHVPFEGANYISSWAEKNNAKLTGTELFTESFSLPDPQDFDVLIILGGPMSIHDEQEFPWLQKEKTFIQEVVKRQKSILGICLGAQLIAQQLGARIYKNHAPEIGWFPVYNDASTTADDLFPKSFTPLHWHGDTFELPDGSIHLGSSDVTKNQGFIKDKIIGLQFHLEATKKYIEDMLVYAASELIDVPTVQNRQQLRDGVADFTPQTHPLMDKVLDWLTK